MIRQVSLAALAGLLLAVPAHAALTPSEQAQIRGFIAAGDIGQAGRVRALVARPDLDPSEAATPLIAGFAHVPFDDRHARFAEAILFGPGSAPSRNALVAPVVQALLARAEAIVPPTGEPPPPALDELVRIHAFVDAKIANAGTPPPDGHDSAADIRDDALTDAAHVYKAYLEHEKSWLGFGSAGPARVRAEAALALTDLARGIVPRHELSTWLGLGGARAELFVESGVLLVDGGGMLDDRARQLVALMRVAPHASDGLALWLVDKASLVGLSAHGRMARAGVRATGAAPLPSERLWPPEVDPLQVDGTLAEAAYSVAWLAAKHALDAQPSLRELAAAAAGRAREPAKDGYLALDLPASMLAPVGSAELSLEAPPVELVASSLRLVLLDMPRTLTLALARSRGGRHEALEQLMIAVSALAANASADKLVELPVGRATAGGGVEPGKLEEPVLKDGIVTGFRFAGHRYEILRTAEGIVTGARMDGGTPKLAALGVFRLLSQPGPWVVSGMRFEPLSGEPRGAVDDAGHLQLEPADASGGFDAAATGEAVADVVVRASVHPTGEGGGILVRAKKSDVGYSGIALLVSATPARAMFVRVEPSGRAVQLGDAIDLPAPKHDGEQIELTADGEKLSAKIDGKHKLATTAAAEPGQVGVTVRHGGKVELFDFSVGAGDSATDKKKKKK